MLNQNFIQGCAVRAEKFIAPFRAVIPDRFAFRGLIAATFFINLLSLALPIVLLQTYDRIIPSQNFHTLGLLIAGVVCALILDIILRVSRTIVSSWADAQYEHRMGCNAFEKLLKTPLSDYKKEGAGTHLENLNAIYTLRDFFGGQALTVLLDIPFVFLFLLLIAYIAGFLVIVPLILLGVFAWVAVLIGKKLGESYDRRLHMDDDRIDFIIEALTGIHVIKSMAMEAQTERRYEWLQDHVAVGNFDWGFKNAFSLITGGLITQLTTVFLAILGSLLVLHGNLTIGGLSACILLVGRIFQPVTRMMGTWARLQAVKVANARVEKITQLPTESSDNLPDIHIKKGSIILKDISFQYKNNSQPILKNASLEINAGETIGILGDGLSGKTTLLLLIMGLITPQKGQVLIDGCDIQQFNHHSLRKQIAYLAEQNTLFDGSILDNLTLFQPNLDEKAKKIATQLGLDVDINRLPQGYMTPVGARTVEMLAHGFKQRLCIARALLNNPRIILFDEANSAIDVRAETTLLKTMMEHYRTQCTWIIVSHQFAVLSLADRIYELHDGQFRSTSS